MKKFFLCLTALFLVFACTACSSGETLAAHVLDNKEELVSRDKLKQHTNNKEVGYQTELPEQGEEIAVVTMESGEVFKIRFFPDEAPKAVYNFKLHAIQGYFNGLTFHRIMENFMIQGGDPEGTGRGGESVWGEEFEDEFNKNLLNIDGAVSMANSGANTNGSQFFINATGGVQPDWNSFEEGYKVYKSDPDMFTANYGRWIKMDEITDKVKEVYAEHGGNAHLDGAYTTTGEGHTVFGQVFEGMDSILKFSKVETTEENDVPVEPVVIKTVEIVAYSGE